RARRRGGARRGQRQDAPRGVFRRGPSPAGGRDEPPLGGDVKGGKTLISKSSLRAEDVMTREVMMFREDTTVTEAAARLIDKRISGAPVVDKEGRLTGVLSEEDLIGVYYEGHRNLDKTPIGTCSVLGGSLVTRKVIAVKADTPLPEIAKKLL